MHGRLNLEEVLDYIFETVRSILLAQIFEKFSFLEHTIN